MMQEDECCVHVQVKLLCTRPPQQSGQWLHTESTFPWCLVFHWSERHERFYNYGTGLYCSKLNDSWCKNYKANGLAVLSVECYLRTDSSVLEIWDTACLSYVSFSFICFSCLTPCLSIRQKQRSLAPHHMHAMHAPQKLTTLSKQNCTNFVHWCGMHSDMLRGQPYTLQVDCAINAYSLCVCFVPCWTKMWLWGLHMCVCLFNRFPIVVGLYTVSYTHLTLPTMAVV